MVGMTMVMTVIVMMVVCLSSHIHDGLRYCQYWRILVLNEQADTFHDKIEEQSNQITTKICIYLSPHFCKEGPTLK